MSGFKDPPKDTRFKPGQSGNPKGRPKKEKLLPPDESGAFGVADARVLEEAERLVDVQEGDERRKMKMVDVVLRARSKAAARGNAYAQRDFLKDYEKAERARKKQIQESCEFWTWYIDICKFIADSAHAMGKVPERTLPLPEDIIIDWEKGVQFVGPVDREGEILQEDSVKFRDALMLQYAFDERISKVPAGRFRLSLFLASVFNRFLARRYQLSDGEMQNRIMWYMTKTKRLLAKELYRSWRLAGMPRKRGSCFPTFSVADLVPGT